MLTLEAQPQNNHFYEPNNLQSAQKSVLRDLSPWICNFDEGCLGQLVIFLYFYALLCTKGEERVNYKERDRDLGLKILERERSF